MCALIGEMGVSWEAICMWLSLERNVLGVNSNIEIFNVYVKNSVEGLKARGEKVDDLVMQLFHGYKAAADSKFVEYMDTKEEK